MNGYPTGPSFLLRILFLILALFLSRVTHFTRFADAGDRRVHIPDELDDVVDEEEDDDWKNWGKKKLTTTPSPELVVPPPDYDQLDASQIHAELTKRNFQSGPAIGFIKLRLGVPRTPESVSEIAMKWTRVLKTGGVELKFMGIDLSTIMFTLERGQDMEELKDFILEQTDAYEVKIGDRAFRRPGDPPLEEVIEMLRAENDNADNGFSKEKEKHKEEL